MRNLFTLSVFLTSVSIVMYVHHGVNTTTRMKRFIHSFVVTSYSVSNDKLKLTGHLPDNNKQPSDITLHLQGLENILHKLKPGMLHDEHFKQTKPSLERGFNVSRTVPDVSCGKLFRRDKNETERAKLIAKKTKDMREISALQYINITSNCSHFVNIRGYILSSLTQEEKQFPIAYSILMYKDVWQFERLLRAIYRPQNLYCLHVDASKSDTIQKAVRGIAGCFKNVFMASKQIKVKWGQMSVLEPELTCMQDLWNRSKAWKYFINLTGQEFPLKTNYELVQILMAYQGANDVDSSIKGVKTKRLKNAGPPPHGLTPVIGSVHVVVSRGYVDSVLHDPLIADLLNWARRTSIPDESFFTMVNHNPIFHVPGSYRGLAERDEQVKPFVARFKNWGGLPCAGKRVRDICIFGIGDLPMLASRPELFANKFHYNYERFALDCMEELIFNNTRDEYLGTKGFDSRWYSSLGFVRNKVNY